MARNFGIIWTAYLVLCWIQLNNAAPLIHRQLPNIPVLSARDNTTTANSTSNSSNSTASLTPTIRDNVETMLKLVGPDAQSRFISLNRPTTFGTDDPVQSNRDLSAFVDRAFVSTPQSQYNGQGWVETYQACLLEVADTLPNLDKQTKVIDGYFETMDSLSTVQAKLVAAYRVAKNESTTNIGVKLASGRLVNALTMGTIDKWAASVFNGTSGGQSHSNFTAKDYKQYLSLNASYTNMLDKYDKLETANKIASQGNMLQKLMPKSPAIFNLSMITAGNPSSPSLAQYSAAWSATIINSASVSVSNAQEVSDNLNDGFQDATNNNTSYASSINDEAPPSTSAPANATATSSGSSSATPTISTNSQSQSHAMSGTPISSTATATATATGSARRSRINRARRVQPRFRLSRRGKSASSALLLAASSGNSTTAYGTGSTANGNAPVDFDTGSRKSFAGKKMTAGAEAAVAAAAPAKWAALPPNQNDTSLKNVTFTPLAGSASESSSSFSGSATSFTGSASVASAANSNPDPLSGVPDIPLQTTSSLFLMSLQEGAWSNDRTEFIPFIAEHHPDIYTKYFGSGRSNGTSDDDGDGDENGMLAKRWTHIILLSTFKANSTELETCDIVGMVWDWVPGLTAPTTTKKTTTIATPKAGTNATATGSPGSGSGNKLANPNLTHANKSSNPNPGLVQDNTTSTKNVRD
ncbi:hypothetical protein GYMLUDRAFT_237133 [Collybiopsis luxurians FD-317 M1]|nr:hypothetical protein GYMLUDRAFT_237133 [Collybiopsis luxurians FD-317 M1]